MTWILIVMIMGGGNRPTAMTPVPVPFQTQEQCAVAGQAWMDSKTERYHDYRYHCVAVPRS